MHSSVARVLLALALAPGFVSCLPDDLPGSFGSSLFRFESPAQGSALAAGTSQFRLVLPTETKFKKLKISLDGKKLKKRKAGKKAKKGKKAKSGYTLGAGEALGTLEGLEPGVHLLSAELKLQIFKRFKIPLTAWTTFEVVDPNGFAVRESVEQLHVTHAVPGSTLELRDANDDVLAVVQADYQGSYVFRELAPGPGYHVVETGTNPRVHGPFEVMSIEGSQPDQAFYDSQTLQPGYGYLTTRDGTQLSVFVALPGPPEDGPYPILVNYSGYDPSQPNGTLDLGGLDLCETFGEQYPILCDAPNAPEALIAGVLGFGTVGVNMRGTGCSGGAYDFFEPLQNLDGYDIIETVAAQPWADKVGMIGISFPGISQLFVAATQPPSLAAITPLAVISGVDTTMAPGGILNDGFAIEWGTAVLNRADPYGHGWERGRVDAGDTICEENQLLHSQKVDIIQKALDNPYYTPEVYDPLNPRTFVDRIQVPVFTTGAWQDEQTGGHFPELWNRFTGSPLVRYVGYNGAHADGFTPQVLAEWKAFLDFFVVGEVRPIDDFIRTAAPLLFQEIFGAQVEIPEDRFLQYATFEEALEAYEAEPPVRLFMESGGLADQPGAPVSGFQLTFDSWPPPETETLRLYFHEDGSLRESPPLEVESASSFQHDDDKGQEAYDVHDAFEKALPDITWELWKAGRQVVFASEPLADDLVLVGHASADLWLQSTADDADIEVTLSEIRPDGMETYITSGWLRASQRELAPESTDLRPIPTRLEADVEPLPPGEWSLVRVEIYPFAHVLRAGSRLRVEVSTPGGNKGRWKFDVLQLGDAVHAVSHSVMLPSSILLPVIPDVDVPTPLPPCPGLRSQPCRLYVPHTNTDFEP